MAEITGQIKISPARYSQIKQSVQNIPGLGKEIEKALAGETTQVIEMLLGGAITLGSSDIHIEPEEGTAKIRLRLDGMLQDASAVSREAYESLLSRIKLFAGLKLNVADRPQDGRFSVATDQLTVEIRASSLPAEYGEAIVLRILNPKSLIGMEALGLRKDLFNVFEREARKPNGMIIVTGPTGSGKTTTLYAFLKTMQKPETKIITIEDPIEYHLKGISQTQVQPEKGYDFASGLKSIVRQDPDIILVGEIRDLETANIALQAALTGHLVLSTLHTNDAAGTISRLTSLGAEVSNIAPAVNIAIAQRLVRKVCKECGELAKASPQELKILKAGLRGVWNVPQILKIPKVKGCKNCNQTGYRGRVGIFEALLIDDEIEGFIMKNPSTAALRKEAVRKGMVSIKQDGLIKVLEGITTIDEVERVAGE